jgi:hypothetical protein
MRLKLLLLLLFGLCELSASATTYYVANTGSDSNNGTSTSTPWRTIAHVNAQTFSAGDSILFHRGDTWREQLVPPSSGSSGSVITFGVYGSGNLPVIRGADLVNTFSVYSHSVYVASVAWPPRELLLDDTVIGTPVGSLGALLSNNEWFFSSGSEAARQSSTSNPRPSRTPTATSSNPLRAAWVTLRRYENAQLAPSETSLIKECGWKDGGRGGSARWGATTSS